MTSRRLAVLVVSAALVAVPSTASAYLKFAVESLRGDVTVRWNSFPIQYFVTDRGVPGVTASAFAAAMGRAFATWEAVPSASIAYRFGGFTANLPGEDDGRSVLGFQSAPELERVLASTSLLIDVVTGELIEADIFFNSTFAWSVAPAGEANRFDLESIAVHEIGHFSGLGHSAIGETEVGANGRRVVAAESVMFPLAFGPGNISDRVLRADDIAGISDIYGDDAFGNNTGSVSGRVTKGSAGVFGAHIVAFNLATGRLVGNFTLTDMGEYSIAGLEPGPAVVRVEPLDDADIESFFEEGAPVDLAFRPKFFERLVVVPRGGDAGGVDITVTAR
jgi:hypothetical protein